MKSINSERPIWGVAMVEITAERRQVIEAAIAAKCDRVALASVLGEDRVDVYMRRRAGGAGAVEAVIKTMLWDATA